jgi:hypothetical protein
MTGGQIATRKADNFYPVWVSAEQGNGRLLCRLRRGETRYLANFRPGASLSPSSILALASALRRHSAVFQNRNMQSQTRLIQIEIVCDH